MGQDAGSLDGRVEGGMGWGGEETEEGALGRDLEGSLSLRGGTLLQGEEVLGFLRGRRRVGFLTGMGSEAGTGGQPNKAGEGRAQGLTGLAMILALTPAVTLALRIALEDKREEGIDGATLLGSGG